MVSADLQQAYPFLRTTWEAGTTPTGSARLMAAPRPGRASRPNLAEVISDVTPHYLPLTRQTSFRRTRHIAAGPCGTTAGGVQRHRKNFKSSVAAM